jgi:hypothetical protein
MTIVAIPRFCKLTSPWSQVNSHNSQFKGTSCQCSFTNIHILGLGPTMRGLLLQTSYFFIKEMLKSGGINVDKKQNFAVKTLSSNQEFIISPFPSSPTIFVP